MRHKHRIKPGYEGGEYVEGNVVSLSVTQHAMWHFAEWQRKGNWEDRVAWRALAGTASKEETVAAVLSEAGKRGGGAGTDLQMRTTKANGKARALQTEENGELFFSSEWQSLQGKKGGQRTVEHHLDAMIEQCKLNVKDQLENGTHPFLKDNRSWDQSEASKKAAATQLVNGVHPFQTGNPTWDRKLAGRRSADTRRRLGINPAENRDKGPNYAIVQENKEKIKEWFMNSRHRVAKNGRRPGAKVCNDELRLGLTSLQPLTTFINTLK